MLKLALLAAAVLAGATGMAAAALGHDDDAPRLRGAFATVFDSPTSIEGLTADRRGDLYTAARGATADAWVSDGGTSQGRVWRVSGAGAVEEAFRVQPMANDVMPGGIGRDNRGLPPGTITITPTSRQASNTAGSQSIVANGLAFDSDGTLYVADTARGAIWRVYLDHRGKVLSPMGCGTTFTPNTLCLGDLFIAHPYLEGADGIVIDDDDTIFAAANERNAIVAVTRKGRTVEVFRNPVATTRLRNEGPLEFPTSPVLTGRSLCVTSSDGGRRDNFPSTPGEGAKVSCARM